VGLGELDAVAVVDGVRVAGGVTEPLAVGDTVPDPDAVNDTLAVGLGVPDVVTVAEIVADADAVGEDVPVGLGVPVADGEYVGTGQTRPAGMAERSTAGDDAGAPAASVKATVTRAFTAVQSMSDSPMVDSATCPTSAGAPRSKSSRSLSPGPGAPAGGGTPRGGRTKHPPAPAYAP